MSFAPCLVPCLKTVMDPASKRRVNRVFKKAYRFVDFVPRCLHRLFVLLNVLKVGLFVC